MSAEWNPIATAPKTATSIRVRMKDGTIHEDAHWASDLSGEEQPAFCGWFIPVKNAKGETLYFAGIEEPIEWQALLPK